MTVSVTDVASFSGADSEDALFAALFKGVCTLVSEKVGPPNQSRCPEDIRDMAVLFSTRRAWDLAKANNGYIQYGPDGQLSVIPADILKPAEPMLKRYKKLGAVG